MILLTLHMRRGQHERGNIQPNPFNQPTCRPAHGNANRKRRTHSSSQCKDWLILEPTKNKGKTKTTYDRIVITGLIFSPRARPPAVASTPVKLHAPSMHSPEPLNSASVLLLSRSRHRCCQEPRSLLFSSLPKLGTTHGRTHSSHTATHHSQKHSEITTQYIDALTDARTRTHT